MRRKKRRRRRRERGRRGGGGVGRRRRRMGHVLVRLTAVVAMRDIRVERHTVLHVKGPLFLFHYKTGTCLEI